MSLESIAASKNVNALCWVLELWIVVVEPFKTSDQLNVIGAIAVLLVSVTVVELGEISTLLNAASSPSRTCSFSYGDWKIFCIRGVWLISSIKPAINKAMRGLAEAMTNPMQKKLYYFHKHKCAIIFSSRFKAMSNISRHLLHASLKYSPKPSFHLQVRAFLSFPLKTAAIISQFLQVDSLHPHALDAFYLRPRPS